MVWGEVIVINLTLILHPHGILHNHYNHHIQVLFKVTPVQCQEIPILKFRGEEITCRGQCGADRGGGGGTGRGQVGTGKGLGEKTTNARGTPFESARNASYSQVPPFPTNKSPYSATSFTVTTEYKSLTINFGVYSNPATRTQVYNSGTSSERVLYGAHILQSIGDSIPNNDNVKAYMKEIDEQFVSSDKTLISNLMKRLLSMIFARSCTVRENIMKKRDIAAKLKSLEFYMNTKFLEEHEVSGSGSTQIVELEERRVPLMVPLYTENLNVNQKNSHELPEEQQVQEIPSFDEPNKEQPTLPEPIVEGGPKQVKVRKSPRVCKSTIRLGSTPWMPHILRISGLTAAATASTLGCLGVVGNLSIQTYDMRYHSIRNEYAVNTLNVLGLLLKATPSTGRDPRSYSIRAGTYEWIVDRYTIVEPITGNNGLEAPLPTLEKLNALPFSAIEHQHPGAEFGKLTH
ncbi:hypothetical protein FXO38_14521 [Capsicum annuum]|nr:hypothetical protein FXO38_14521 [Capsicum annuum]KAF3674722.1 hypothetical protein FXO37_06262 [Capsicum annuum]